MRRRDRPQRRSATALAAAVALVLAAGAVAEGAALDASFGDGGKVVTSIGELAEAFDATVQADGAVVVGGQSDGRLVLVRYRVDGALDPSFGARGAVIGASEAPVGVVARRDGSLVVGTRSFDSGAPVSRLLRFDVAGAPDGRFGTDGAVALPPGLLVRVLARGDGRVVALLRDGDGAGLRVLLAGYRADGSVDTAFGRAGTLETEVDWTATDAVLAPDGRIVVAGVWLHPRKTSSGDGLPIEIVLARYQADGSPDVSFGRRGVVRRRIDPADGGRFRIALQLGGGIVVSGRGSGETRLDCCGAVWRFRADGTLDRTFGNGGKAVTRNSGGDAVYDAQVVAVDRSGRIVVAGLDRVAPGSRFGVARFTPAGRPDLRFGREGVVTTSFGGTDRPWALALAPGRIVAAGGTGPGLWLTAPRSIAVARYRVPPCVVPQLRSRTRAGAVQALTRSGCRRGRISHAFSATVPRGRVVSQARPALEALPEDTPIGFVVSRGPR